MQVSTLHLVLSHVTRVVRAREREAFQVLVVRSAIRKALLANGVSDA